MSGISSILRFLKKSINPTHSLEIKGTQCFNDVGSYLAAKQHLIVKNNTIKMSKRLFVREA